MGYKRLPVDHRYRICVFSPHDPALRLVSDHPFSVERNGVYLDGVNWNFTNTVGTFSRLTLKDIKRFFNRNGVFCKMLRNSRVSSVGNEGKISNDVYVKIFTGKPWTNDHRIKPSTIFAHLQAAPSWQICRHSKTNLYPHWTSEFPSWTTCMPSECKRRPRRSVCIEGKTSSGED